ncbi:MAG: C39 family peptidase [Clostridia bacterium]|nr:C39 family peptidase [Clostridia bacterium]
MEEDENRGQVSQESMEDSAQSTMDAIQTGANAIDDATSGIREKGKKYLGDKLKSTKMGKKVEKAKAKARAVADEAEKGTKKVVKGATTLGTGAALSGLGTATHAAGASMSAAGQAITASTLGIGAAIGETMDAMGKGMQKAGQSMVKGGNKLMKKGTETMKKGTEQIAKAPMAEPGKSSSSDGADGPIPKPKIPGISGTVKKNGKKTAKKVKKFIKEHPYIALGILVVIILLAFIIFMVLGVSSTVNRGKYVEGDLSNVPYVVNQLAVQNIEVFSDGSGGYTYGFVDENGNPRTFDETVDNILEILKKNESSALSDMGTTDDERKEFLKLLIKAEVATQYPDLTVEGTGTYSDFSTASGITVQTTGKDFVVATDAANAANVLDEAGLTAAVTNSDLGEQAKQNVLGVVPDLVRLQDQYKVNAVFLIAAARTESGCGTGWDLIDPSTYNWLSVKGSENGGYVDRNGTSWNKFSSYAEATESWFKLITGSDYYFKAGKYTVKEIAPTYCNTEWGETVCRYMEEFYGYAGASSDREIAAVSNTTVAASPSQSQSSIAQWGWVIQNEDINAYYYEHGYGNITYDSPYVNGYITQDGKNYIVVSNSTGWYIGQGVQLYSGGAWNDFNINLLKNHGVDTSNIQVGSTIDANVVDLVSQEIFEYKKNEIKSQSMAKGLSLTENQIVALVDISYLNGNVDAQLNNIATYGADSEELANTSGFAACNENDTPTSREQATWKLFHYGKYEARSGNPYDPSYFGGSPADSEASTNSNSASSGNASSGTSNSGIAQAGGVDANGVTITSGGNIDFLNYAIDCHALVREEEFYYGQGRSLPVTRNDRLGYIDCSCYVSMALDAYGLNDWSSYPHQLTASGGSLVAYAREKNFDFIYEGSASSINEIPDIQSGDIVLMPGHTQIFYGYTSSGESVWLNCGSTDSILKQEGDEHGWYATPITYVIRVPGGSGNGYSGNRYSRKAVQVLTNNEDSVEGKIKIKRKDSSGKEIWLEYIDEGSFDSMIQSNNSNVMNYYTLKKGASTTNNSAGSTTSGTTGSATLTGSDAKEQIWNFLIDSGLTEQGAAGLMGNIEAESGFNSMCVEDDWARSDRMEFDTEYTRKVDSGEISESTFVTTGGINSGDKGYGLVQWTTQDRKQNLYNYVKSKGTSIGDLQTQLEFLVQELQTSYSAVWNVITTSNDINECSDVVLKKFEIPRDITGQTPKRRQNASNIYSTYMGTRTPGSGNNTATTGSTSTSLSTNNQSTSSVANSSGASNTIDGNNYPLAYYAMWLTHASYSGWGTVAYHYGYASSDYRMPDKDHIKIENVEGYKNVGPGVLIDSSCIERFKKYGVDVSNMGVGDILDAEIVMKVSMDEFFEKIEKVKSQAQSRGVTLTDNQAAALGSCMYSTGNINSFWKLYDQYGSVEEAAEHYTHTSGNSDVSERFYQVDRSITDSELESMKSQNTDLAKSASRYLMFKYGDIRSPRENFNQAAEDLKSGKLKLGGVNGSASSSSNATTTTQITTTSNNTTSAAAAAPSPEMALYKGDGYDFNRFWIMTISYEDWDVYSYRMNLPDNVTYEGGYNVKKKISEDRQTYIVGRDEQGNPDVGMGVWLGSGSSNFERFESHGISGSSLVQGFLVSCDITDQVSQEELLDCVEKARKDAQKNGVTLKEYQLQAVADAYYNYGSNAKSCKSFWTLYKQYGESDELAKQCGIFNYVPENTTYESLQSLGHGTSRKSSRWMLFKYGKYIPRHKAYYGNELELNIAGATTATVSFDNFLFLGDSRYVGVKSELEALGSNVSVCAVSSSTAKDWSSIIDSGSGTVLSTSITLPDSASGVSVMLGANSGAYQIPELKEVMEKLHTRYPSAKIYFNSVYHLGSNYTYANVDDTIAGYDRVNEEMKTFCSSNSDWAVYVDITNGLHDENGYLKYPDDEGIHLVGEGKTILVDNIKTNIKGAVSATAASSANSEASEGTASSSTYVIAVASYDKKTVTSVDSYQYAYTKVISTNSGTTGYGSQFSSTPAGRTTSNTTLTYKTSYIDYQPAVKNHTMFFDFLWALFITTGNKGFIQEMAQEAMDSKLEITVYEDTKVTQNVSTSTLQPKIQYMKDGSTAYEDHYNGTNTTTTTNTIVSSKGCLTLANVWNMEYENNAKSYSEFKSKSKEKVREKIEDDDNIVKILRKGNRADRLSKEYYLLERMLGDNARVSHMIDIFKYYVGIALKVPKEKLGISTSNIIDTNLFDLSNSENTSTVKVLLYTRLNISESEKEMMYKAVEQMTAGFPDDDKNTQRKKYIASVILNRALSSKFPDSVADVLNQTGQFPNYDPTAQSAEATYSDSTKAAVDAVIQGGDCAKYSVYFNTPSGAEKLKWDTKYQKTFNDGDESDSSYTYYTDDAIVKELQSFEVSVAAGTTMPSDTAQKIVAWAEAQVGKSSFYNSYQSKSQVSTNYCAAFVECAYYEAGLGYYGGNAMDLPHPNQIQFNDDGTVNYSKIPVGAILVSKGVPVDGVEYGHVCLYVGNGYVIEAGGSTIQKKPVDDSFGGKGHNCAPFVGWGFAVEDQDAAYQQLVIKIGGGSVGNYPEGWTQNEPQGSEVNATGVEGYYVANGRQYAVYAQGFNDVWGGMPYSMQTFGYSACGATSVAIIASAVDPTATPIETAQAIYSGLGLTYGSRTTAVTSHEGLSKGLDAYGIKHEWRYNASTQDVIAHLQSGNPVIVNVHSTIGNNYYSGHYVTLLGINAQGEILLGDPAGGGNNSGYFDQSKIFPLPEHGICFIYYD